ncbi:DNA recombination protein RmuC [Thermaurantiacus sp.]
MDQTALPLLLAGLGAFLAALVVGWLAWGRPLGLAQAELAGRTTEAEGLRARLEEAKPAVQRAAELQAKLAAVEAAAEERARAHAEQLAQLRGEFQRVAGEALERAQKVFTEQAEETLKLHRSEAAKGLGELIQPVKDTLGRFEAETKAIEQKREQAYGSLAQQLRVLAEAEQAIRAEAGKIVAALKGSARTTGVWGEAQLRRVLEVGGLTEGIDFTLQARATDGEGEQSQPDAIIHLPGGRSLVVDAKCALDAYLEAQEATTERDRAEARARHAARVKEHAKSLMAKAYWSQFADAPDFVLMFVPGENFLTAALEEDPGLHLWAMARRVLLVGPTNLLAIARVVALVWRQQTMAEEARKIADLGAELYGALAKMLEHLDRLGQNIRGAGDNYNQLLGSLERNVLPKARRFTELGVETGSKEMREPRAVEVELRPVPEELGRIAARQVSDGG